MAAAVQGGLSIAWGVALRPFPGQVSCGDCHVALPFPAGVLLAAIDGLGHGEEAELAARAAAAVLQAHPAESVISLVRRCHADLATTRGVVMTVASYNRPDQTLTWIGVGNVAGVLVREDRLASPARETVVLRGGVVGYQLPPLSATVIPVCAGDTLVLVTDGVRGEVASAVVPGLAPGALADRILAQHGTGTDDALVLVAQFRGHP